MVARHECVHRRAPVAQTPARRLLAVVLGILSLREGMALHSPALHSLERKRMRREHAPHLVGSEQLKQGVSALELFAAGTAAPLATHGPPSSTKSGGFEIGAAGSVEVAAASASTGLRRNARGEFAAVVPADVSAPAPVPLTRRQTRRGTMHARSSATASAPVLLTEAKLGQHDTRLDRSRVGAIPAAPSGIALPPEQQDNTFKISPAQAFVIGSTGIDSDNLLAEDQALVTTPPPAAPVAAAAVAPLPAAAAGTAAPAVAAAAAPPAVPAAVAGTAAPVAQAAPAVPVAAAAAAVPATAVPVAAPAAAPAAAATAPAVPTVVQGAATNSSGGGGGYIIVVMLLLIAVILLGVIFVVRAKMQKPPGRGQLSALPSTGADDQDSQFWKSAKARQSYRKSHSQPILDSDAEGSSITPDTGKRRSSRDGRARRQSTIDRIKSADNAGGNEAENAAGSEGKAPSYKERRTQLQGPAATSSGQGVEKAAAAN